jgi:hypothetical protein
VVSIIDVKHTGETAPAGYFVIARTDNSSAIVEVQYALAGTAQYGVDYTSSEAVSGAFSLGPGEMITVSVDPTDNSVASEHDRKTAAQLLADPAYRSLQTTEFPYPHSDVVDCIQDWGGTGLLPTTPTEVQNGILLQFIVQPPGVGSELTNQKYRVNFDLTRRVEAVTWNLSADRNVIGHNRVWYPTNHPDSVNDDVEENLDPSSWRPDEQSLMYDWDGPGVRIRFVAGQELIDQKNFEEFLRVGIGDVKPAGGDVDEPVVEGSRASGKVKWYSRLWLVNVFDTWQRATGDVHETNDNCIRLGTPNNPPFVSPL